MVDRSAGRGLTEGTIASASSCLSGTRLEKKGIRPRAARKKQKSSAQYVALSKRSEHTGTFEANRRETGFEISYLLSRQTGAVLRT